MSQSKNFDPNLSRWPFSMLDSATHDDTSGYDSRSRIAVSLAEAGPPDSQVNNTPFCHQDDSQDCLQPPGPPPRHIAARNEISSQLVWSFSESLATVPVVVPTRMTIAAQPELANRPHIARSHTLREIATRHFLIALQPRHAEAPQLVRMESNHRVYDSTAQTRQHPVVATRKSTVGSLPNLALLNHPNRNLRFLLLT